MARGGDRPGRSRRRGLALAKEIYAGALEHMEELCAPYATVIDIDRANCSRRRGGRGWSGGGIRRRPAPRAGRAEFNPPRPAAAARRLQDRRQDGRTLLEHARSLRRDDLEERHPESVRTPHSATVSRELNDAAIPRPPLIRPSSPAGCPLKTIRLTPRRSFSTSTQSCFAADQ